MNLEIFLILAKNFYNHNLIQDFVNIKNKISSYRNNTIFYNFFSLIDIHSHYYFYAPNIAMQIIKKCHKKGDYSVISREHCESIISNEVLRNYIEISTELHEFLFKEILGLVTIFDIDDDFQKNFLKNQLIEYLGFIGFYECLGKVTNEQAIIKEYEDKRKTYIPNGSFVFPIPSKLEQVVKDDTKNTIEAYEKFNLIFSLITRIIHDYIFEYIIYINKSDIKIRKVKNKECFKYFEFEYNNIELLFKSFPLFILDGEFMFSYAISTDLINQKSTYKCFTLNFSNSAALTNTNIFDSIKIFNENRFNNKY